MRVQGRVWVEQLSWRAIHWSTINHQPTGHPGRLAAWVVCSIDRCEKTRDPQAIDGPTCNPSLYLEMYIHPTKGHSFGTCSYCQHILGPPRSQPVWVHRVFLKTSSVRYNMIHQWFDQTSAESHFCSPILFFSIIEAVKQMAHRALPVLVELECSTRRILQHNLALLQNKSSAPNTAVKALINEGMKATKAPGEMTRLKSKQFREKTHSSAKDPMTK